LTGNARFDLLNGMARDYVEARLTSNDFPCEKVQIHSITGREGISRLSSFELEIVSTDPDEPTSEGMAGAEVTLIISNEGGELRRVHGIVAEVVGMLETEVDSRVYRLRVAPRAHRLTLVETQEIYMDLTVPEIIQQKLALVGLGPGDVEMRLRESYPRLEFVVQYKETDLAFISRLAEHVGISFFFEHDDDRDVDRLVFTDGGGFQPVPGRESVPFRPRGEQRDVFHLEERTRLIPTNYVLQDYNYRTPQLDLTATHESQVGYGGGVVEHGAHFKTPEAGKALAKVRAEEREATRHVYSGKSAACELRAGGKLRLEGHARRDGLDLLLVEVQHRLVQPTTIHAGEDGDGYVNSFEAIDAALTYRPPRITPRPRIHGLITGVVEQEPEAPPGDYAKIDEQGRYTVKFLFDTAPPGQRKASRPVRMLQPHAGPDYGMHFPLKPGIEVLLGFIDGDPDRPLIVGAVPNPETPSPVTRTNSLANRIKTASGIELEMKDV
jgi:type VI secretion system secreted protein VgrG